jgi:hypothetical protein
MDTDLGYPTWDERHSPPPLAGAFAERMERKYGGLPSPGHMRADHGVRPSRRSCAGRSDRQPVPSKRSGTTPVLGGFGEPRSA